MRLLIVTQAVDLDDPVLGFFHRWIQEFAKHCGRVNVICLKEGRHELPGNISVYSLGKESGASRIKYIWRFYKYAWTLRREYDSVFVHMNPEYSILGGLLWRAWGKRVGLWYVHRARTLTMRLGVFFSHMVFTSAESSVSVRSRKIKVVGHGIDTAIFAAQPQKQIDTRSPRLVAVARISPIKHLEVAIGALSILRKQGANVSLDIIGAPLMAGDAEYEKHLRAQTRKSGVEAHVKFLGSIANSAMPQTLAQYDIAVNASPTGGIDKAALESMASGVPTFVSNTGFKEYFAELSDELIFKFNDAEDLARRILAFLARGDAGAVQKRLRLLARERADVSRVIPVIMGLYYDAGR